MASADSLQLQAKLQTGGGSPRHVGITIFDVRSTRHSSGERASFPSSFYSCLETTVRRLGVPDRIKMPFLPLSVNVLFWTGGSYIRITVIPKGSPQ